MWECLFFYPFGCPDNFHMRFVLCMKGTRGRSSSNSRRNRGSFSFRLSSEQRRGSTLLLDGLSEEIERKISFDHADEVQGSKKPVRRQRLPPPSAPPSNLPAKASNGSPPSSLKQRLPRPSGTPPDRNLQKGRHMLHSPERRELRTPLPSFRFFYSTAHEPNAFDFTTHSRRCTEAGAAVLGSGHAVLSPATHLKTTHTCSATCLPPQTQPFLQSCEAEPIIC